MAPRKKFTDRLEDGERKARSIRLLPSDWEKLDHLTSSLAMRSGETLTTLIRNAHERMVQTKKNALSYRDDVLGHPSAADKGKP